ncbi:11529_t:CDS:2 [Dentiscutata heterogama]|uniref:11529_t:CDS:1 n=1 Tax=Dentiscutata heterogama TaxID=1316150 RepID=A0ACA9MKN4_9GLOM|nr:11529_t:CDS:2 [Dentiscutata heterogama]
MSVATLTRASNEINDKETVICKLENKKLSKTLSSKADDFNAIKQEDDEKKDIKVEKVIKKEEDKKKGIKIEDLKATNDIDSSKLTKQELLKLIKKLEQQNLEYEKQFCQQEEKIKNLQKEIKEKNKENSLMKWHIDNLNKEFAGMEKAERQYKFIEDVKWSYFHNWFSYVPLTSLTSISSNIQSSPTAKQNEDTHQKHFINQFNQIYSNLVKPKKWKYSTHNTCCLPYLDGYKPDVSVTELNSKPTSSNVIIVGELKRDKLEKRHYEQVFNYGIKVLNNQKSRKKVFAFLTNHQQIVFFKIQRKGSTFSREHTLVYNFNYENIGWRMLMTLVQKDKNELGCISVC